MVFYSIWPYITATTRVLRVLEAWAPRCTCRGRGTFPGDGEEAARDVTGAHVESAARRQRGAVGQSPVELPRRVRSLRAPPVVHRPPRHDQCDSCLLLESHQRLLHEASDVWDTVVYGPDEAGEGEGEGDVQLRVGPLDEGGN